MNTGAVRDRAFIARIVYTKQIFVRQALPTIGQRSCASRNLEYRHEPCDHGVATTEHYLAGRYYENWRLRLERLLVRFGLVGLDELSAGHSLHPAEPLKRRFTNQDIVKALTPGSFVRPPQAPARFKVGDCVRAKNLHPKTHTRLPRYVRGHVGVIVLVHGERLAGPAAGLPPHRIRMNPPLWSNPRAPDKMQRWLRASQREPSTVQRRSPVGSTQTRDWAPLMPAGRRTALNWNETTMDRLSSSLLALAEESQAASFTLTRKKRISIWPRTRLRLKISWIACL
jgi:hypothetical protein